jgi:hypothetical protein
MSRKVLLAMLLAGLLVAAPMAARAADDADAADEEYDDEEDGDAGGDGGKGGEDEKDVVVIGDKNWTEVVGKSKYALVSVWFEREEVEEEGREQTDASRRPFRERARALAGPLPTPAARGSGPLRARSALSVRARGRSEGATGPPRVFPPPCAG